jgi:hypothetical protein
MATCPGSLIVHRDGTTAGCTNDDDQDPKEGNPGMTNPEDFQWPLPVGLSDNDVKKVYVELVVRVAAFKESTVDEPTDYMAALARADVSWIEEELDRRGVPRGTFDDIEPEDFGILG